MVNKPRVRRPRSIALYRDVEAILETVVDHNEWPAKVKLASPSAAIKWCQRANILRSILREQEEARMGLPPGTGSSAYDQFKFVVKTNEVWIEVRDARAVLEVAGKEVPIIPRGAEDDVAID